MRQPPPSPSGPNGNSVPEGLKAVIIVVTQCVEIGIAQNSQGLALLILAFGPVSSLILVGLLFNRPQEPVRGGLSCGSPSLPPKD